MSSSYRTVTNKKREYRCFDVCDWLQTTLFAIGESPTTRFLSQYTSLVQTVLPQFAGTSVPELMKLARRPHELLLCCFEQEELAAIAQASLIFPAGQPVVTIDHVVVESSRRGLGLGSLVIETLEVACNEKWATHQKLLFVAANKTGRNSDRLFTGVGYRVQPMVQYVRQKNI
jgi:GNAT superfamily N-acetyltransferase